jgi:MFS superfamily sulfate permease-like transporter
MNLAAPLVGGVPMCHGAGGMAGHVRFGAHTGGAPIILGSLLLLLALFLGDAVVSFMAAFPPAVLGVILFLAGTQLALGAGRLGEERGPRFVALVTTALALWNVGAAFVAGLALHALISRGVMKP